MSQNARILEMLEQAGEQGVFTADFKREYIGRHSARILELRKELRKEGRDIKGERVRDGSWRWWLEGLSLSGREKRAGQDSGAMETLISSQTRVAPRPESDSLFDMAPVSGTKSAITNEWL